MVGWEYPPLFAGGPGKASQGLARGLAECGAQVRFLRPRYPLSEDASFLTVGGAGAVRVAVRDAERSTGVCTDAYIGYMNVLAELAQRCAQRTGMVAA
ncbi:MAG: glycogen/starch synthase [Gammaproteobacteria bacterium]|nr:glycogen/starch synthase [Gammaproteobacteria bacterium]